MATTVLNHPILRETMLSMTQAARRVPAYRGDKGCNSSTIMRWLTVGILMPGGARLKLEGLRLAGRWVTSVEAIDRFLVAQHDAHPAGDSGEAPATRTPTQRQRAAEKAGKQLGEMGV